jgi:SAM-dependent methyltransferase
MALRLESVVPWGRTMAEYVAMFDLTPQDLELRILDCGGGPASFNAELTERGGRVVSCDPIYRFGAPEIERRVEETYPVMLRGVEEEKERFVWTRIRSPAELGEVRLRSMRRFLEDFEGGMAEERYRADSLPALSFRQGEFDLALCSHLLFLYSDQFDVDFHLGSIRELLRVARQVRIFPLLDLAGKESAHLRPVTETLERAGYTPHVRPVPYEFQKSGDRMLVVERSRKRSLV